jgi:hypothetical protein
MRFKRSPFGIFINLRASYSLGLKLPITFSVSISTSAKKWSACSAAIVPIANSGRGVSTLEMAGIPSGTLSKPKLAASGKIFHAIYSSTASRPLIVTVTWMKAASLGSLSGHSTSGSMV